MNPQNNCKWSDWELHFSAVPSVMEKPSISDYAKLIQEFLKIWITRIRSIQLKIQQHFSLEKNAFLFFFFSFNNKFVCTINLWNGRYCNVQLHLHRAVAEEQKVMWLMLIKNVSSCTNPAQLSSPTQSYNYHDTAFMLRWAKRWAEPPRLSPSEAEWSLSYRLNFSYSTFRLGECVFFHPLNVPMQKLCSHWPLGCAVPGRLLQNSQNHEIRTKQLFQAAQSVKISGSKAFNLT